MPLRDRGSDGHVPRVFTRLIGRSAIVDDVSGLLAESCW